ncbi:hypothetical protein Pyn_32955 [Prunus yedoensis var. nudiflora]|uniref:non-specific serine/threonine protein kinase n=1 Tax=Prunus yedoensis var. nudiflora TaxID=2094558 RepID=A0A314Y6R5_PRUYE|nr:hypothetical protein Pyn_32955 [Prunus yedoensis var. nudiflora]
MAWSVTVEARLTPEAKDLISRFLCDVENRLGRADQIKAHPWFKDIAWDKLYEVEAAFKPEVNGELDTQNFMKYDEVDPPATGRTGSGPMRKMLLTPKDLSFVGYTYKNFEAVKGLHQSSDLNRSASLNRSSIDSAQSDSVVDYSTRHSYSDMEAQVLAASEDVMSE